METKRTTSGRVLSASEIRRTTKKSMKLFGEWYQKSNKPNIIFACVGGSHSYGFATTESDIDIRGIWMANAEDFFKLSPPSPNAKKATIQSHNENMDIELQELNKFVYLALKNNPNILDALFVPEPMILMKSAIYDELRQAMPIILNKTHIYKAYRGYALQQFSRMKSQYTDSKEKEISVSVFTDEEYEKKLTEMRQAHDRNDWDNLLQRKIKIKTEVPVPKSERKLNVKNAAHLLRLLATGEHVLRTGDMKIIPPNKEFIIQVRKGVVSWEKIMEEKERLEKAMEVAYEKSIINNDESIARNWANDFLIKVRKNQISYEPSV